MDEDREVIQAIFHAAEQVNLATECMIDVWGSVHERLSGDVIRALLDSELLDQIEVHRRGAYTGGPCSVCNPQPSHEDAEWIPGHIVGIKSDRPVATIVLDEESLQITVNGYRAKIAADPESVEETAGKVIREFARTVYQYHWKRLYNEC